VVGILLWLGRPDRDGLRRPPPAELNAEQA
jgi:hypothetical protein